MPIHVEPLVGMVRFFPGDGETYGDEWDAVCTLRWTTPTTVLISGLSGTMRTRYWRELREWLKANGVEQVTMIRHGRRKAFEVSE